MSDNLSNDRLTEERAFMKRYTEGLSSHKVNYQADFSAPLGDRPRKINPIGIEVAEPPDLMDVDTPPTTDTSLTLTVKSLKPSLTFSVTAQQTDTVAELKSIVSKSSNTAPSAESQRLLLKGKALTDTKLLKEYGIENGAVVHLVIKAAAPPPASSSTAGASSSHARTPSLTITTSVDDDSTAGTSMPITDADIEAPPLGPQPQVSSALYHKTISDPAFWQKMHSLCVSEFVMEDDADATWEIFLLSMKNRLSAGEAAKIRDVVGVRGMGGGA